MPSMDTVAPNRSKMLGSVSSVSGTSKAPDHKELGRLDHGLVTVVAVDRKSGGREILAGTQAHKHGLVLSPRTR